MRPKSLGSPLVGVRSIPVWFRIALASLVFFFAPALKAATVYVDVDAAGADDGTSWTDAYPNLQDALAAWSVGDEIWVAEGRYFPDLGALHVPGDQTASFQLIGDMKLYGGFVGTEDALGKRDPAAHVTVLSGDIDKNDGTDPDGITASHLTIAGSNSHNVVGFRDDNNTAVLDGFSVTGGDAKENSTWEFGGGIIMSRSTLPNSQVMIRNVLVQGNRAFLAGGGLYNLNTPMTLADSKFLANSADDGDDQNGDPAEGGGAYVANNTSGSVLQQLQRVEFDGNFAEEGGGLVTNLHNASGTGLTLNDGSFKNNTAILKGGGMLHAHGTPVFTNLSFLGNKVDAPALIQTVPHWGGGGLALVGPGSQPSLTNITFKGNEARSSDPDPTCPTNDGLGGAVHVLDAAPTMNNVLFSGNRSDAVGGAIFIHRPVVNTDRAELNNATFAGNFSEDCGKGHVIYYTSVQELLVQNSILWGNAAGGTDSIFTKDPALQFKNSIVQGCDYTTSPPFTSCGADGGGNLTDDPLFVDQTPFTGVATLAGNNRLTFGSPAIDVGDNGLVKVGVDLDNRSRIVDGNGDSTPTVDMGTYELPSACPNPASPVLHVDKDATGANTGLTWTDALPTLQDALLLYENCPGVDEIWVAEGIYYPDRGGYFGDPSTTPLAERRTRSFQLTNDGTGGIIIYGGFAGTESSTADRAASPANVTVLSGDIEQNDTTDANGVLLDPSGIVGTNSNHVLSEKDPTCAPSGPAGCPLIDRFSVTGGDAWTGGNDGSTAAEQGGGMWSLNGVTTLSDVRFQGNQAIRGGGLHLGNISENLLVRVEFENNWARDGGGMAIVDDSSTSLDTVTFRGNKAMAKGSGSPILGNGGGAYIASASSTDTKFLGVNFYDNVADDFGGGIFIDRHPSGPHLVVMNNVIFEGNEATGNGAASGIGGAMATSNNNPTLDLGWFRGNEAISGGAIANLAGAQPVFFDSLVSGNLAQVSGGGIYNDASSPQLTNLTLASNRTSGSGGGMLNENASNPIIRNTIFWSNAGNSISNLSTSTPEISFSLLQGCGSSGLPWDTACGTDAGNNIEPDHPLDPIFVAPIDPATAPSVLGDFHLDTNSPAVDVGNNADNNHYAALGGVEDPVNPIAPRKLDGNGDGIKTIDMGAFEAPTAGRIKVMKATVPTGSSEPFYFEILPTNPKVTFALRDGDLFDGVNLVPGTYEVVESTPGAQWIITSATCDDGSDPSSIDLKGGTTVTCTFQNTQAFEILINKNAPGGGTGFVFAQNIDGSGDFQLNDGGSESFGNVPAGTYRVTEQDPAATGYELVGLTCQDSTNNSSTDVASRTATIQLDAGDTVTCNFTNTEVDTVVVEKITVPNGAGGSFRFSQTVDASGDFGLNGGQSKTFTNVSAGTRTITEADPGPDFVLTDILCHDAATGRSFTGDLSTRTATLSMTPGDRIHCAFTNTHQDLLGPLPLFPGSVDFGGQVVGTTSAERTSIMKNNTNRPVVVTSVVSANPGEFIVGSDNCSQRTLLPGETCTFGVRFSPAQLGLSSSQVNISSNLGITPYSVTGTGAPPAVAPKPPAVSIPTLGFLAQILLLSMLALIGGWGISARKFN